MTPLQRFAQMSRTLAAGLIFCILLNGCRPAAAPATPTSAPTATTAPTSTQMPTHTPVPTSTPTETPAPTATPDKQATAAANQTATAVALDELVRPDLVEYGINPKDGHLAWKSQDTIKLEAVNYQEEKTFVIDDLGKVGDFVLKTNVSWNSTGGLAGCAITFRAEEDLKQGAHYSLYLMRLQFMPFWDFEYHKFNQWQATLTNTGKPLSTSKLNDDKNSSNVITLIARGNEFTAYFNDEEQPVSTHDKLKEGSIALMSWQDSGKTTCKYSDTWVWLFDQ